MNDQPEDTCRPVDVGVLQNRVRLANQARRAKEHQLDDIRRALCDIDFMEDDDPYSHADLAGVIRQNGEALHHAPADPEIAERLRAAIESEIYEYRERTMFWEEGGVTTEIARLATRGALEALGMLAPTQPRDETADADDEDEGETGVWTPDPPIRCLTVEAEDATPPSGS